MITIAYEKKYKEEGEYLKRLREARGLSQNDITLRYGIHTQRIQNYEQGVNSLLNLRVGKVGKFAEVYGKDKYELMKDLEKINEQTTRGEITND